MNLGIKDILKMSILCNDVKFYATAQYFNVAVAMPMRILHTLNWLAAFKVYTNKHV